MLRLAGRLVVPLAMILLLAECGTPGPAGGTSTAATLSGTGPGSAEVSTMPGAASLAIMSTAFADGGAIPRRFTCDGVDVSPPLAWSGAPPGTAAYALVVTDPDARGFVHWVASDLPGSAAGLPEGATGSAAAGIEGRNSFGRAGWSGPCPPGGTHHYRFELLALSGALGLGPRASGSDVLAAASGRTLARATLTGTYRRGG